MIARRRLRRLEGSLSPRQAVVAWLVEARTYPSVGAYAAAMIDEPAGSLPLERILDRVERAVRTAHRGERPITIEAAVIRAIEEAVTCFEVVLRLNAATHELTGSLRPRLDALAVALEGSTDDAPLDEPGSPGSARAGAARERRRCAWRDLVDGLLDAIEAEHEARLLLERRYLDGRAALFTEVANQWRSLARGAGHLATRAETLGLGNVTSARARRYSSPSSPGPSIETRAEERASAIAAAARLAALELVGADRRAAAFVSSRLRTHPDGADLRLVLHALERLARPRDLAPPANPALRELDGGHAGVAALAHPLDATPPAEQARQLRLVADELDPG